eukprot:2055785-Alexandrium_andersonii.AAC.1
MAPATKPPRLGARGGSGRRAPVEPGRALPRTQGGSSWPSRAWRPPARQSEGGSRGRSSRADPCTAGD